MNQHAKLLLTHFIMQIATFVEFIIIEAPFTMLDYFIIFIFMFFFAVVLIETFLHRYCSHRAFKLNKKVETFLLYCSTFTLQPPSFYYGHQII